MAVRLEIVHCRQVILAPQIIIRVIRAFCSYMAFIISNNLPSLDNKAINDISEIE